MKQELSLSFDGIQKHIIIEPAIYQERPVDMVTMDAKQFYIYHENNQWHYLGEDAIDEQLLLNIGKAVEQLRENDVDK